MGVGGVGGVAKMKQISRAVYQFGQAAKASKDQTVRQMQSVEAKQSNAKQVVVDTAVEMRADAAKTKSNIIDMMA